MYQADDFCDPERRRRQPFSVFIGFAHSCPGACSDRLGLSRKRCVKTSRGGAGVKSTVFSPAWTAGAENGGNVRTTVLKYPQRAESSGRADGCRACLSRCLFGHLTSESEKSLIFRASARNLQKSWYNMNTGAKRTREILDFSDLCPGPAVIMAAL